jgi:hypothetical protein
MTKTGYLLEHVMKIAIKPLLIREIKQAQIIMETQVIVFSALRRRLIATFLKKESNPRMQKQIQILNVSKTSASLLLAL